MWAMIGILVAGILIVLYEVPSLMKKKSKKELFVFIFLFCVGEGLFILLSLEIKIPNPLDFIAFVFNPLSQFLEWIIK
ncbi:hypothetical protein WQ54_25115 [Bacillus sp. SA1-12]|uniref:hypothetical protein n=1 Tax=Bacillus sp. SA1-12 TaxID=1455638 RepID=UPI000626F5A4|nr:hypothetical protein [Bacillus sp. SA1-12]KKI89635.1 hypothetical protein WQ54_25115 [Bacillus sp. SA1-12]